ncbi:MAG: amidohydrolase family protein [Polyangiaceae bacterium]
MSGTRSPLPCLASIAASGDGSDLPRLPTGPGFLAQPLPALDDREGSRIPAGLPPVVDAHVHVFPHRLSQAIWRWFDQYGWPIRYRLGAPEVVEYLLERGVERVVALTYAHKPGIARSLNDFVVELCRAEPRVLGCATVFPGESGAIEILGDAFAAGLVGVKLHCHVQGMSVTDDCFGPIYECCVRHDRPAVIHAGREPKSPGYKTDPHALCSVDRVDQVLREHPRLRLVVPHLGADEFDGYARLLERHAGLWLDTTMAVAGYFPTQVPWELLDAFPGRILYGSDFPNLPFAWDRELTRIVERRLSADSLQALLGATALRLFGGSMPPCVSAAARSAAD